MLIHFNNEGGEALHSLNTLLFFSASSLPQPYLVMGTHMASSSTAQQGTHAASFHAPPMLARHPPRLAHRESSSGAGGCTLADSLPRWLSEDVLVLRKDEVNVLFF